MESSVALVLLTHLVEFFIVNLQWFADILRLDLLRFRHENVLQPPDDGRAQRVVSIQSRLPFRKKIVKRAWLASVDL